MLAGEAVSDLSSLFAPLEGDPAGPDLTYDERRQAIEAAFSTSADGGRAEDVAWPRVIRDIRDQARITRDLWLGVYLARAGAMAGDLETVADGAQLLAGLLETGWEHIHPSLEEDGYVGRRNACNSLAHHAEFIQPLRRVALIAHPRLGSYSAADLERFEQEGEAAEGYGKFRGALEQTGDEVIEAAVDALDRIRDALRRSDAVLVAHADEGETGTDFSPTFQALAQMRTALTRYSSAAPATDEAAPAAAATDEAEPAAVARPAGAGFQAGRIESRDDVLRALDAVADYYRRREPGSAVPLALRRARDWVPMTFIEVLRDIAPSSMDDARRVLMSQAMAEEAGL